MAGVYFDSSIFTSIFKPEKERAQRVRALLRELKKDRTRIHTSILSVQETSVITFKRGQVLKDYHARISEFANIHTINKDIATNAAKLEADICDDIPKAEQDNPRRKWDCFHIATARHLNCSDLFTWDRKMIKRKEQLGIADLKFSEPSPKQSTLFGPKQRRPRAKRTTKP